MWLGWILFLELFGHHAVVSAETCILETNDLCDWKDVKDVNDITSEAIVAFYTAGMNKLELKPHPEDSKAFEYQTRDAEKYPEEPQVLKDNVIGQAMFYGKKPSLTCSMKQEGFPNACSTLLEFKIHRDKKPGIHGYMEYTREDTVNVGMALYFYSTYSETEKKSHEIVESVLALGTEGLCHKKYKVTGQCLNGMSDKKDQVPRPVEDPPMPPSLGEKCQPKFPQLKAQRPPWGLVPILLILLLIVFLLGGAVAVYFYLERQRRTQEETALRSAQEVEMS